jgi:hypothetical protein
MMWFLLKESKGTILFGEAVTDERYQELTMDFVTVLQVQLDYWLQ